MNEKLKWILVKGGLCFALISYVWQVHIKEDTIPFGSVGGIGLYQYYYGVGLGAAMYHWVGKNKLDL